jgi:PilZ domain
MTPDVEQRYHPRVPVQWPTVFFASEVFGHGTVVDVSALAWRIRGSLPLVAGMQLTVLVWPQLSGYFEIEEGTVLWANDHEFALEIYQVRAQDIPAMVRLQEQTLPRGLKVQPDRHTKMISCGRAQASSVLTGTAGGERPHERRTTRRMLAHCHVHYRRIDGCLGVLEEGVLKDVSSAGCQVITEAALEPGQIITLVVYFNDGQLPISLPGTTVCWVRNHRFGVRFPAMTCDERKRLDAIAQPNTLCVASYDAVVDPVGAHGRHVDIASE